MTHDLPHVPVMPQETVDWLEAAPGKIIVDGTFGAGGHSRLLLEAGADVIGIDQDPAARTYAAQLGREFSRERFEFLSGNFRDLENLLAGSRKARSGRVDGLLLDLGVSSMQLDEADRGFAFRHEGPLDMRMSGSGPDAADIVNGYPEEQLAALIYRYGEERHSRRIARAIRQEADREP
ncbi:MAG TPA: 16S rRNA (cytosine(1402)-N(4))-methyltransferase RsmH, partial [Deinococcales bacterium]|nr:16S rRNA (cytosine(1402)-N(4))-methyltransferase RsmH [Deinococcales bacterium]